MSKYYEDEDEGLSPQEFLQNQEEQEAQDERETQLRPGFLKPEPIGKIDSLKRAIVNLLDVDEEYVESLQPKEGVVVDLEDTPTRREAMGYSYIPTPQEVRRQKSVPKWARQVQCPKCGSIMTVIKAKRDIKFGENIMYQCHTVGQDYNMCLVVVQITTDTFYWVRPGDFTATDWDWRSISEECTPVLPGVEVKGHDPEPEFVKPVEIPPAPWIKRVVRLVIWEKFWESIMTEGEVGFGELVEAVQEERPQDKEGKFLNTLRELVEDLPEWMQLHTGYVVKSFGGVFTVVGKDRGSMEFYPFSDEAYREKHGF